MRVFDARLGLRPKMLFIHLQNLSERLALRWSRRWDAVFGLMGAEYPVHSTLSKKRGLELVE